MAAALVLMAVLIPSRFVQQPLQCMQIAWPELRLRKFLLRMAHIQQWVDEATSSTVKALGHLHNEYLQTLMDHGLWGRAGVVFMLMRAGLSHMNFAHNDYPTELSLAATLLVSAAAYPSSPKPVQALPG